MVNLNWGYNLQASAGFHLSILRKLFSEYILGNATSHMDAIWLLTLLREFKPSWRQAGGRQPQPC